MYLIFVLFFRPESLVLTPQSRNIKPPAQKWSVIGGIGNNRNSTPDRPRNSARSAPLSPQRPQNPQHSSATPQDLPSGYG